MTTHTCRRARRLIERLMLLEPEPLRGAEIGVHRGETSMALLRQFPRLTLYMVDAWTTYAPEHRYRISGDKLSQQTQQQQDAFARQAELRTVFAGDRRRILRMESKAAAALLPDGSLDFVFIDADHTYEGVMEDLQTWYPKVRVGGLLSGHDYHKFLARRRFGVIRAVDEFTQRQALSIELAGASVWTARK